MQEAGAPSLVREQDPTGRNEDQRSRVQQLRQCSQANKQTKKPALLMSEKKLLMEARLSHSLLAGRGGEEPLRTGEPLGSVPRGRLPRKICPVTSGRNVTPIHPGDTPPEDPK